MWEYGQYSELLGQLRGIGNETDLLKIKESC
jgi:hypothetical protein